MTDYANILNGKNAVVTGSSSGLGLGIAKFLSNYGCNVVINGRDENKLRRAENSFNRKVFSFVADVSLPNEAQFLIEQVLTNIGRIDILVTNVGSGKSVLAGEEDFQEWQRVFSKNLWSTTNVVEAARDSFNHKGGSITCISSICGIQAIPGAPITYSVAKSALNSYVKSASFNLYKKNIRINAIAPGNLLFTGSVWEKKLKENKEQVKSFLDNNVAMKRLGEIDEIANAVCFLSSNQASFCTGTVMTIDGGQIR